MRGGSGGVKDELFDLNKEPVERKRKRSEINRSSEKGNEVSNGLPKSGRVLRSRTVAMSDGEKHVIKMEIVDEEETEVPRMEYKDEGMAAVLQKGKKKKGRRGRPPKIEGKREVPPVTHQKRRGRPPKLEGKSGVSSPGIKCEVPSLSFQKKRGRGRPPKADGGMIEQKRKPGRPPKTKRKPGRPPKTADGGIGVPIKKKIVKKNRQITKKIVTRNSDNKKFGDGVSVEGLKVGKTDLGNVVEQEKKEKETVDCGEGDKMGLRERKQLLRDQIVAMLNKAGWTVERRQRQSKLEYWDAVYVDRQGKTYWSVTLAYKKFKESIDNGKAEEKDVMAFSVIPEETLRLLFRNTEIGKKAGKKKGVKRVKKESSKSRSLDGKNKSRRTLLARTPKSKNESDADGYALYEGKRSLLTWMIDLGTVPLSGKIKYKRRQKSKILREGRITKEGICCDCCNITYNIRGFESHAGSTPGNSYNLIYLESGKSLFQCLVDSWRKYVESNKIEFVCVDVEGDDPNDDTCNVCGDGGDLICCDSCPSTFHNGCLHIKVPSGDWHCVYCSCKFCGMSTTDDEDDGDDHDLSSQLLTCRLCEEKFHLHCVGDKIAEDFQDEGHSFCGNECLTIREKLQDLLGVRHDLGEEFSYTVLQHHVDIGDASLVDNYRKVESNSKLAVAFSVMDECFEPIIDERSGTNMIRNVVYSCGSNIRRLNYDGFYTIILEKGDDLVSAASIRIHGRQLAEMPFIGTRFMYRRQGMCGRLLNAIETVLSTLGVEKLVIPAISELNKTWTTVFGFLPLEESKKHEMRYMSVIAFPGIDMLQKSVQKEQKDSAASQCTEVGPEHSNIQESCGTNSTTSSDPNTIQPNNQDNREEQSEDILGVSVSKVDISPKVEEVHKNNKDANVNSGMANEIDINIEAVNDDKSLDNGNCLNHLDTSKDDDISSKRKCLMM